MSSVAKASAAAWMVSWHDLFKGMEERRGSREVLIQGKVSFDSSESFLLSVEGSRMRTHACLSIGISIGN